MYLQFSQEIGNLFHYFAKKQIFGKMQLLFHFDTKSGMFLKKRKKPMHYFVCSQVLSKFIEQKEKKKTEDREDTIFYIICRIYYVQKRSIQEVELYF